MSPAIKEALAGMDKEIARLEGEAKRIATELAKTRAVKAAIEKANGITHPRAPVGHLRKCILEVLKEAKRPMTNGEIRSALKRAGYKFSLLPIHVTKQLMTMLDEKKPLIKRTGEGARSTYELVR